MKKHLLILAFSILLFIRANSQICYGPPFMTPTLGSMYSPDMIINGDFNNDGKLDFIFTTGGDFRLYLGNGSGGAWAFNTYTTLGGTGITSADYNKDGNLDVAIITGSNVEVFSGNGSGNFSVNTFTLPGIQGSPAIETSDFNNDGNKDIVVDTYYGNYIQVLLGNGLGGFGVLTSTVPCMSGGGDLACNDFNLDGNIDIAFSNACGLNILFGNGTGNFPTVTTYTTIGNVDNLATSDFNKDGKPDLAMVIFQDVQVYFGNGLGGFTGPSIYPISFNPWMVETKDLNGDGMPDLAVGRVTNDDIAVLINQGSGTFASPQIFYAGAMYSGPQGLTLGDYNGDGINDIALADGGPIQSGISIFVNNGPTVTATSSSTLLCTGQSATLTAGGANTYLWLAISTATTIVVTPTVTTTYTVKGTIPGCINYATVTQSVSLCQGTENLSLQESTKIYPNPTSGSVNIILGKQSVNTSLKLTNISGQIVYEKANLVGNKINIDLSDQASGVYFVEVNVDGESYRTRVLKD